MPNLVRCEVSPSSRRRFGVEVEMSSLYSSVKELVKGVIPSRQIVYKDFNCQSSNIRKRSLRPGFLFGKGRNM